MKKILLIVLPLLLIIGCSKPINESTLIKRGEHMYEPNATKPFSGKVFELHENGETAFEGSYKDGFKHGDWTYNTKIRGGKYEVSYTAGSFSIAVFTDKEGTTFTGSPIMKEPEKDGTYLFQEMSDEYDFSKFPRAFAIVTYGKQDGKWTEWYENGQKESEGTYKDGKRDGLWTSWYNNGQKEYEETWKNDKRDGLFTRWFPNGVKESEGTYKEIAEATEDAVISAIRAGLETYATEQLMAVGRRSWPTNPWDGLETKPAGYWDTDENAADSGEWRFNTRTENITHMRADNTIWHWDYDKGTQSGSNAATGSFGSRQEGVGD